LPGTAFRANLGETEDVVRRLERSRSQRILMGVCGGLAEYLRVDPDLIRVIWILSVLCGGVGIIPYVVAIFLLPEGDEDVPTARSGSLGARLVGLALIALAGVLFFKAFHLGWLGTQVFAFWTIRILLPMALLVAGVFLLWPRARGAVGFAGDRKPHRSVSDRVIAGVAGGIASELGVDPNLARLAFVLATVVTSGFAALIYVLLIVVLPEEELGMPASPVPPVPSAPPPGQAPASPPPAAPAAASPSGEGPGEAPVDPEDAPDDEGGPDQDREPESR
jgi:phage shock protein C